MPNKITIEPQYLITDSGTSDGTQIKYYYDNKYYKISFPGYKNNKVIYAYTDEAGNKYDLYNYQNKKLIAEQVERSETYYDHYILVQDKEKTKKIYYTYEGVKIYEE